MKKKKKFQRKLEESEERLKMALSGSKDIIWEWYIRKNLLIIHETFLKKLGIKKSGNFLLFKR